MCQQKSSGALKNKQWRFKKTSSSRPPNSGTRSAVAALAEALNKIDSVLGGYAGALAESDITPDLLSVLAADTQLCLRLGMSAGHALLLGKGAGALGHY